MASCALVPWELLSKNEKRAVFFLEYLKNLSECSPKRKIAT
jgi:hypothetical protein